MLRNTYLGLIVIALLVAALGGCGGTRKTGLARGQDLYKTCIPCHGTHGGGSLELRAPAIAGLPEWYVQAQLAKFKGDIRGAHPDDNEGHRMRPMARTLYQPGDLEAVAAYVAKLPAVPAHAMLSGGDAAAGQQAYTAVCVACHGPDGRGLQAMNAPPLNGQADWYLLAQLKKFKTGMRGSHPEDISGSQMRAMSSTLQDTTAMRNVVAYIKTLPN